MDWIGLTRLEPVVILEERYTGKFRSGEGFFWQISEDMSIDN